MLHPPECFAIVDEGIYRSNALQPVHFPFVKTLALKTAIVLSAELPTRSVINFFEDRGIRWLHLGLRTMAMDWKPVTEELIKEGLELILNPESHPILIMDTSGEAGVLIGCLRRLQGWSFNAIVVEFDSYSADGKNRYLFTQFIECFDLDLVRVPKTL